MEVPQTTIGQASLEHLPDKRVMGPVHKLFGGVMQAKTFYEAGAIDGLHEARELGQSVLLLMTHFNRVDPLILAQITQNEEPLQFLRFNTGITARRSLFSLPLIMGYVVRHSGAQPVDRAWENSNETPEEKLQRQEANLKIQAGSAINYLVHGLNWLVFPEGGSRKIVETNGEKTRVPRERDKLLPIQRGFAVTIDEMRKQYPEAVENVRMLSIVSFYGDRRFASLRPTVLVSRLEQPVNGTQEDIRKQGENMLQRGLDQAIVLDSWRQLV